MTQIGILALAFTLYVLSDSYGWRLIRRGYRRDGNFFINLGGGFLIGGLALLLLTWF